MPKPTPEDAGLLEEAERSIVGQMAVADPLPVADFNLRESDFLQPIWQHAFAVLSSEEQPVGLPVLEERLRRRFPRCGPQLRLIQLPPTTGALEQCCRLVRREADRRALREAYRRCSSELYHGADPAQVRDELAALHERQIDRSAAPDRQLSTSIHDLAESALASNAQDVWGMSTGLLGGQFDKFTGGLQREEFWILGGAPGRGKSTLLLALALGLTRESPMEGVPLMISMEMTVKQIGLSILAMRAAVAVRQLVNGQLGKEQRKRVEDIIAQPDAAPIEAITMPDATPQRIAAAAKAHQRKKGLPLLLVDPANYAGLAGAKSIEARLKYDEIALRLADLSITTRCCLVAAVHLNKAAEVRRPAMGDLMESSGWARRANRVLLYDRKPPEDTFSLTQPKCKLWGQGVYNSLRGRFLAGLSRFEFVGWGRAGDDD